MKKLIQIPDSWYEHLKHVIESDYFRELGGFIHEQRSKVRIFPETQDVFRVFKDLEIKDIRVLIIGLD